MEIPVEWQKSVNPHYFYSVIDDNIVYVRINNFPDEPLLTLINCLEIIDIENRPRNWTFEKNQASR